MKLHSSSIVLEGISHLEDLPLDDFIKTVKNLKSKVVTEKLDGANLWFGVDENGFFTSREGKSKRAKRFYDIKDYPLIGNYNGFRAAHLALKKAESAIKRVLENGDMIEIEVLFGRQPNTVTYGADDKNYIVILRAVDGTSQEKADSLSKILDGKTVTVKSQIVTSPDGDKLEVIEPTLTWQFTQVKPVDTEKLDTGPVMDALSKMEEWLSSPAENVQGKTNQEVVEINLGSVDKGQREQVKAERERLKEVLLKTFKQPIKEFLLDTLVRKVKPFLQTHDLKPEEDVGVEGIVLRDKESGEMTKIVDKDVFTAINKFNNVVRGNVSGLVRTDDQNAPIDMRGGVFGQAKIRIGNLFGMKELALSSSARKLLTKFKGEDAASTAQNVADNIQVSDFEAIRHKVAAILKNSLVEVDEILDQFKQNSGSYKLKLKTGKEIGMSSEVMKRNLTAFAETKRDINQIITAVLKSRTMPELIMSLYGRTIQSIFETDGEDEVKESAFAAIASLGLKALEYFDGIKKKHIVPGTIFEFRIRDVLFGELSQRIIINEIYPSSERVSYDYLDSAGRPRGESQTVYIKVLIDFLNEKRAVFSDDKPNDMEKIKQSIRNMQRNKNVKESLFKQIHTIAEDGEGGQPGAATTSGDIAPVEKRLFGNRVITRRKRKFVPQMQFARAGTKVSESKSLIKMFEYDMANSMGNYNQFATDVDDSVASRTDVEFKQLRNTAGIGNNGAPVTQTDVSNYLDKAHELNDEVDTITFGMEMDDGSVAKVYVNATQADQFEQTLAQMLGQEDDLEKVINDLSQTFDIVDVEWPEALQQTPTTPGELPLDSKGDPVLDPVIDLGNLDDPPEDDEEGGLLKAINGMKDPEDIELAPGAELPPEETNDEEESDEESGGQDLSLLKSLENGEDQGGDEQAEPDKENLGIDTTVFNDEDRETPPDEGGDNEDDGGDEGGGDEPPPPIDGADSGNQIPDTDLGDLETPDDEASTQEPEIDDEEASDAEEEDDEPTPPKKKKKEDDDDQPKQESIMPSFGEQFKNKLLQEKKESKVKKEEEKKKKVNDDAEEAHDFPPALKKLMLFFPQRGEKMMVALMWALGAPLDAMVMKKSELRDTVTSAGAMYQKDSQFRLWVGRVMDAMIAAEKAPNAAKDKKEVKEAKLEDELNNVLQKLILGILDKIGLPASIERIARLQLRNNVREKSMLVQNDSHLRAYMKILGELLGVDAVTGMKMESVDLEEGLKDTIKKEYTSFDSWKRACKKIDKNCWLDGDSETAYAMVGAKPSKRGKTVGIGGWDGEKGCLYRDLDKKLAKIKAPIVGEVKPAKTPEKKVKEAFDLHSTGGDEQETQQQQQPQAPSSGTEAWVQTVKDLAIALGVPADNVTWKEQQTDMAIKKQRLSIKNSQVVLKRAQQLLALIKQG